MSNVILTGIIFKHGAMRSALPAAMARKLVRCNYHGAMILHGINIHIIKIVKRALGIIASCYPYIVLGT